MEKQNECLDGDSMKMERCCNDNMEGVVKKLEINENGGIKVERESIEKNDKDEKKEFIQQNVCRDFLNNRCSHGSRCKFYHPPSIVRQRALQQTPEGIDYQNRGCHRDNCRYIHAHRGDADRYKMTGEVTLNLVREIAAVYNCDTISGIPFCTEYQTGLCSRGEQRCRYWHINVEEERERRCRISHTMPASLLPPLARGSFLELPCSAYASRRSYPYRAADAYGSYGKRMRYNYDYVRDLEHKNTELSKEVEGFKRELARERERYGDLYAIITSACYDYNNAARFH